MTRRTRTYDFQSQLRAALGSLEKDRALLPENHTHILNFRSQLAAEGISLARQLKYVYTLRKVFSGSSTKAEDWARTEVDDFCRMIEAQNYSEWTRHDYRVLLGKFLKWLHSSEEHPPRIHIP